MTTQIHLISPSDPPKSLLFSAKSSVLFIKNYLNLQNKLLVSHGKVLKEQWMIGNCLGLDPKVYVVEKKQEDWVVLVKFEGKILSLDVNSEENERNLKKMIEKKGFSGGNLIFNGMTLKNPDKKLKDSGITHNSVIFLAKKAKILTKVVIFDDINSSFTLDIALSASLTHLKSLISSKKQTNSASQRLFLGKSQLNGGEKSLNSLGITDMSAIRLIIKRPNEFILFISNSKNRIFYFQMPKSTLISQLKAEIAKVYQKNVKFEVELSRKGEILSDNQTFEQAKITNRAKLQVKIQISVIIRDLGGKMKRERVEIDENIGKLQEIIEEKYKIPRSRQEISCFGVNLQENQPILSLFSANPAQKTVFFIQDFFPSD